MEENKKIKVSIIKQLDGYYKISIKDIGHTYANSLEDIGIAIEEILKLNNAYATEKNS
jgi:DNA-directed RNA polymerase subunit L